MDRLEELCRRHSMLEKRAAFWWAIWRMRPLADNAGALEKFYAARSEAMFVALHALTLKGEGAMLDGHNVRVYDSDMEWVVSLQSGTIENGDQGKLAELDEQLIQELWGAPVFEGAGLTGFTSDRALGVTFSFDGDTTPWGSGIPSRATSVVDRALRSMGLPGVTKVEVEPADGR